MEEKGKVVVVVMVNVFNVYGNFKVEVYVNRLDREGVWFIEFYWWIVYDNIMSLWRFLYFDNIVFVEWFWDVVIFWV